MSEFDGTVTPQGLTDDVLMALARQSVQAMATSMTVALEVFSRQMAELHVDDDLRMCVKVLNRVLR